MVFVANVKILAFEQLLEFWQSLMHCLLGRASIFFSMMAIPIYKALNFIASPVLVFFFFFCNDHPDRGEVISHCGLDLHFCDD